MTKIHIIIILLLSTSVFATKNLNKGKTIFSSNPSDNWFIAGGAGISGYFGDEDRYIPSRIGYYTLLTTNYALWGGKWISPSVGIKGELNGFHTRGWNPSRISADGYYQNFNHIDLSMDMMFDCYNLFHGYNGEKKISFIIYLGPGISRTYNNSFISPDTHMIFKSGGTIHYNLKNGFSIFSDIQGTIVPEIYDGAIVKRSYEGSLSLTAGVCYRFPGKQRGFTPCCIITEDEKDKLNDKINTLQNTITELQENCKEKPVIIDSCESIRKKLMIIKQKLTDAPNKNLSIAIHYNIDKWNVRASEMYKLEEIAKFMTKYPFINISVTGFADIKTAFPAYNLKLSEKRAVEVIKLLNHNFGIDINRIKSNSLGDTKQPFLMNELNRAVIVFSLKEKYKNETISQTQSSFPKNSDTKSSENSDEQSPSEREQSTSRNKNLYETIHFLIDKWNVRETEIFKIEKIAKYLTENPEVSISVTGYADIKTAYPSYNLKLGERRAKEVIMLLITRYSISKDRVHPLSMGDRVQPFAENDLNRAVIAFDNGYKEKSVTSPEDPNTNILPIPEKDSCLSIKKEFQKYENNLLKQNNERLYIAIHYNIDKWDVIFGEMYKLDYIAQYMNNHPKAKISITGYADIQTAFPEYNLKLSERRVNEVTRLLNKTYNIPMNRMKSRFLGDMTQPFDLNDLNRAVIVIDIDNEDNNQQTFTRTITMPINQILENKTSQSKKAENTDEINNQKTNNSKTQRKVLSTIYRIQILASKTKQPIKNSFGLTPIVCHFENGLYKYTYGESTNRDAINRLKIKISQKFKNCFIVTSPNEDK